MRIVAGALGGRRLKAPPGEGTRPTSERVREAIFNILGPPPAGCVVLDLFAGAGALALEALSRGAERAIVVDNSRAALRVLRANIAALELGDRTEIRAGDSLRMLDRLLAAEQRLSWIFLDPPYRGDLASRALTALGAASHLDTDVQVIVEHDRRNPPLIEAGCLIRTGSRRYGDTCVSFYGVKS